MIELSVQVDLSDVTSATWTEVPIEVTLVVGGDSARMLRSVIRDLAPELETG